MEQGECMVSVAFLPGTEVLQQTADRGWVELKRRSAVLWLDR